MKLGIERVRRLRKQGILSRKKARRYLRWLLILGRERATGRPARWWQVPDLARLEVLLLAGELEPDAWRRALKAAFFRAVLEFHGILLLSLLPIAFGDFAWNLSWPEALQGPALFSGTAWGLGFLVYGVGSYYGRRERRWIRALEGDR